MYDTAVPKNLKRTQEWFSSIISMPLIDFQTLRERTRRGGLTEEESKLMIRPTDRLAPHKRIELYAQQYWWRLIKVAHEGFPTLKALLGADEFNQKILVPYLDESPPTHWSLSRLGENLHEWILANMRGEEWQLYSDLALLDATFNRIIRAGELPSITDLNVSQEKILTTPLLLQPKVALLRFPYDILSFRSALLDDKPKASPQRGEERFFILARGQDFLIGWKELLRSEWLLLETFKVAQTLDKKMESLEEVDLEVIAPNIQSWFGQWTSNNWITLES